MPASRLELVMSTAAGEPREVIATLSWPAHLEDEARAFIRDNLLAERLGDATRAAAALARGFIPAAQRARFLADKAFFPPEAPEALASQIDLEDLVAAFSEGLRRLRTADPALDLRFEWRA